MTLELRYFDRIENSVILKPMSTILSKKVVDDFLNEFDLSTIYEDDSIDRDQVNIWLPVEYKKKFALAQRRSKKKFGKVAREMLMGLIDRAGLQEEAV